MDTKPGPQASDAAEGGDDAVNEEPSTQGNLRWWDTHMEKPVAAIKRASRAIMDTESRWWESYIPKPWTDSVVRATRVVKENMPRKEDLEKLKERAKPVAESLKQASLAIKEKMPDKEDLARWKTKAKPVADSLKQASRAVVERVPREKIKGFWSSAKKKLRKQPSPDVEVDPQVLADDPADDLSLVEGLPPESDDRGAVGKERHRPEESMRDRNRVREIDRPALVKGDESDG